MEIDVRSYRILSLVGQGGFGKVYKARLETKQGFVRDVAVKLLNDANPPVEVLQRFRDEARVLGLVRDRAIVSVEPPIRLRNRWAVVMEFVDGCNLSHLLRQYHHFPSDVALDVVAEVARVLDKVWHVPGPDGQPLRLVHRDLKPSNVQVTAHGEVKVLDFGIARADFSGREAESVGYVMGTPGYIAPERFEGREGPASDVFSLGVILEVLLTGWSPQKGPRLADEALPAGVVHAAVQLARDMTRHDPDARPSAREVERRATQLAAANRTVGLRGWAEHFVPPAMTQQDAKDDLSGEVLSEARPSQTSLGARVGWLAFFSGGLAGVGGLVVAVVAVGVAALAVVGILAVQPPPEPPPAFAAPAPEPRAPAEPVPVEPAPAPVEPAVPGPPPDPAPLPRPSAPRDPCPFVRDAPPDLDRWVVVNLGTPERGVVVRDTKIARRVWFPPGGPYQCPVTVNGAAAASVSIGPLRVGSPRRYVFRAGAWVEEPV